MANISQIANVASSQTDPDFNINAITFYYVDMDKFLNSLCFGLFINKMGLKPCFRIECYVNARAGKVNPRSYYLMQDPEENES